MLWNYAKQRDYYIYAYIPDKKIFQNLPLNVIFVTFLYLLLLSVSWVRIQKASAEREKQEREKEEKYKEELLKAAKRAEAANRAKTEFLQRMSHDIRKLRSMESVVCSMWQIIMRRVWINRQNVAKKSKRLRICY